MNTLTCYSCKKKFKGTVFDATMKHDWYVWYSRQDNKLNGCCRECMEKQKEFYLTDTKLTNNQNAV